MSAITPSTDLYLLKSPIEIDMNNQLTFANATAQANYFSSLPKLEVEDISYQRKDSVIRFPAHIDNLLQYNYVMYKNDNYSNKWFYAFITDMQYLNDNCTAIFIKTDPYQTWMFDLQFKQSFVEREHVSDDTVGNHLVPEYLDTGEFVCSEYSSHYYTPTSTDEKQVYICVMVSDIHPDPDDESKTLPVSKYQCPTGLYNPCGIYAFSNNNAGRLGVGYLINAYYKKPEAILSVFLIPRVCSEWESKTIKMWGESPSIEFNCFIPVDSYSSAVATISTAPKSSTLDGYTPKNNKMFTSEFFNLYVTNNAGEDITFRYEDYTNNLPNFVSYGCFEQGGSLNIVPTNSKKTNPSTSSVNTKAWNESISLGKLPTLAWITDYYLNWQAKNGGNIIAQTALAGISTLSGFTSSIAGGTSLVNKSGSVRATAGQNISDSLQGGIGTAVSFADKVREIAQQVKEAKYVPDQAHGNVTNGSLSFSTSKLGFEFRNMTCRYEYAKRIDDYLSAFGYRVNSFKIPNITGRQNWNYVKCVDVNIEGDIPQMFMQEIKAMFDKGVTLWHNPATFLDYSQNNPIV